MIKIPIRDLSMAAPTTPKPIAARYTPIEMPNVMPSRDKDMAKVIPAPTARRTAATMNTTKKTITLKLSLRYINLPLRISGKDLNSRRPIVLLMSGGKILPEKGQLEPQALPIFGIDWDRNGLYVTNDGESVSYLEKWSLVDFNNEFAPCIIVLEAQFESYAPVKRNAAIQNSKELGSELLTVPSRYTGREIKLTYMPENPDKTIHRSRSGSREWKEIADYVSAVVIFEMATKTRMHLKRPALYPEHKESEWERFNEIRRGLGGLKKTDPWVVETMDVLPPFSEVPTEFQNALGNASSYALGFMLPMIIASKESSSRKDFERRLGNYAHGYPSFCRATYMRRFTTLAKREQGVRKNEDVDWKTARKSIFPRLRGAVRWVYHMSKSSSGKSNPV